MIVNLTNEYTNFSHSLNNTVDYSDEKHSNVVLTMVKITYYATAAMAAVLGNGLVVVTVSQRKALHRVSYVLVATLALKDFSFALLSAACSLPCIYAKKWIFGDRACVAFGLLTTWLAYVELLLLVALSLDRYFACIYPLRYHQLVTRQRLVICLAFCWAYSFVWAAVPLLDFGRYVYAKNLFFCQLDWSPDLTSRLYTNVVGACLFYPGTGVMIYCYVKIYKTIPQRSNQIMPVANTTSRRHKATLTIAMVTGVYFFCWIPFVAIRISHHYIKNYQENSSLLQTEETTVYTFTVSNFINPLLYAVYMSEFRSEVKKLIKNKI